MTAPQTKLVCTLGPASVERVDELVAAGMSVARLNLSHGDEAFHRRAAAAVRAAEADAGRPIALLADLPGPKVRLGDLAADPLEFEAGRRFELRLPDAAADADGAPTTHAGLAGDLEPGDRVLLADGAVELRVVASVDGVVHTVVERGGEVRAGSGIGVPSERLSLPALPARDRELLRLVRELEVDYVGQSFVRSAGDVAELRELLGMPGPGIVAKIETAPAVANVDPILVEADALMVARGDLGVELPFEEVPLVQKRLVRAALAAGRPAIVATQMLESMTSAPRPTRAEAGDVANAVIDGADAVMLSGETAIGAYPLLAAQAALRIARAADRYVVREVPDDPPRGDAEPLDDARAVAVAGVALAAADPDVRWIACFTRSGRTARFLATLRPSVPVLAVTPDEVVARALALVRGVSPTVARDADGAEAIREVVGAALADAGLGEDDAAVLVASTAGGGPGPNLVEVVRPG